jgi:hypothetical protein
LYNLEVYIRFNERIEDISKQLNGWRKQTQAKVSVSEKQPVR